MTKHMNWSCLLFLFSSYIFSTIFCAPPTPTNCNEKDVKNDQIPFYRLGDIGRELPPACYREITEKLHKCHVEYLETIKKTYVQSKCYAGSESVKRTMCCSLWDAKRCMVRAATETEPCRAANISDYYSRLPIHSDERINLNDQCSEYRQDSPICRPDDVSGISLTGFVMGLFVLMSIPFIIIGILKARDFYEIHKNTQNITNVSSSRKPSNNYQMLQKTEEYHDEVAQKTEETSEPDQQQQPQDVHESQKGNDEGQHENKQQGASNENKQDAEEKTKEQSSKKEDDNNDEDNNDKAAVSGTEDPVVDRLIDA